jgi:hypothetical protein
MQERRARRAFQSIIKDGELLMDVHFEGGAFFLESAISNSIFFVLSNR